MQARPEIFGFRVSKEEREMIAAMAEQLERTPSDAIRFLLRQAARDMLPAAPGNESRQAGHSTGQLMRC